MARQATSGEDVEPAPWTDRRFVVFATGNFINNMGEGAYKVVLPLYVYELTASLTVMSLVAALSAAMLFLGPWLGAVVDRFGPRVFVVPGLLVQLAAAIALNVTAHLGLLSIPLLFAFVALVQLGGELYRTGWIAGVKSMFPVSPARSRALLSSLFVTSNIVGPILVAAGLSLIGYLGILWINAATFLAPLIVWALGVHPPRKVLQGPVRLSGLGRDVIDGWLIIRETPQVLRLEMMTVPLTFSSGVGVLAFLIWYLRDVEGLSASNVSLVQTLVNVGALVGSLYIAARASTRPHVVLSLSAVVMTASLFVMTAPSITVLVVAMVIFFTLRSAVTAVSAMVVVKYLEPDVIGRAEGMFNLFAGVPLLIAPLLIPLVERSIGADAVLLMLGTVAALSLVLLPRVWSSATQRPATA